MEKRFVFLTPGTFGGVLDQTNKLAQILKSKNKIKIIKFRVKKTKIIKENFTKSDIVVLQYSPYGFAKRGTPFWLLKEIISLKKRVNKIIIIFHELYAVSFYPWKSAFWLCFLHKFLYKKFAKIADQVISPSKEYFEKLNKLNLNKKIIYLPSFSNIGEMKKFDSTKDNILVIFGLSSVRTNTYKQVGNDLFIWAKANNIRIIDIGPKILDRAIVASLNRNKVTKLGILKPKIICKIFQKAKYGLLAYDINRIDKSGTFNSYAAFGIIPIIINNQKKSRILRENFHYISLLPKSINKNKKISKNIWNWYQKYNLINASNKINNLAK